MKILNAEYMGATERQLNASELSDEHIDRIAFAVMARVEKYSSGGIEKPLTRVKAAEHLNMGVDYIDKLKRNGVIQAHYFEESGVPYYFASEINEALKGRKKRKT